MKNTIKELTVIADRGEAYAYYVEVVETEDLKAHIKALRALGVNDQADLYQGFIDQLAAPVDAPVELVEVDAPVDAPVPLVAPGVDLAALAALLGLAAPKVTTAAPKVTTDKRDAATVYPDHGGDMIFLKYRLKPWVEGEHNLYAGAPRFCKTDVLRVQKALAIRNLWFARIHQAQADGDMRSNQLPNAYYSHAYWLTRYARQQIKACFTDVDLKEYYTDDMPMPSAADAYNGKRKTAPKK